MAKKALVLGGGGAKGSYQMGVWKALREIDETDFDIVAGTSIGALNGALIVQNDFDAATEIWDTIEYKKVFGDKRKEEISTINSTLDMVRFAINDAVMEGSLDSAPLENLVKEAVDEEKIRGAKSRLGIVAVELPILRPITPMIDEIPKGDLYKYLMASSACFPVFSPYEINGVKYIDGGYYDNVPINFAIEKGAESIIAVDLDGVGLIKEPKDTDNVSITRIYSRWDLGAVFDFDQNLFLRNRRLGYLETMKAFGEKEGCYYTFSRGETNKNRRFLSKGLEKMRKNIQTRMRRPVTRTITAVERDGVLDILSRTDSGVYPSEWIGLVAEITAMVYGISPEREYSFSEFNKELLERHLCFKDMPALKDEIMAAEDVRKVIATVLDHKDSGKMSSALVGLMQRQKHEEALKFLSGLIPKEYIAAEYINLIMKNQ